MRQANRQLKLVLVMQLGKHAARLAHVSSLTHIPVALCAVGLLACGAIDAVTATPIEQATLEEPSQPTAEISTAEMQAILAAGSAVVIDARPSAEYALGHIPGAINVAGKSGVAVSQYVSDIAEIAKRIGGDKSRPLVLYCNGPHCGKSKRLAAELAAAGYRSVRRYQLGMPVWRALGHVAQIELEGAKRVMRNDLSAVLIDARAHAAFEVRTIARARNIPWDALLPAKDSGVIKAAKEDGRLPMDDHDTRIIVFGSNGSQARAVAESIAREAFYNVNFFDGSFENLSAALR